MDRTAVSTLIIKVLSSFVVPDPARPLPPLSEDTILFGKDGLLDSIALVTFVLDVEEAIREEFGISLTLADEKAMSQSRSPFRRVSNLAEYAVQLAAENRPEKTP